MVSPDVSFANAYLQGTRRPLPQLKWVLWFQSYIWIGAFDHIVWESPSGAWRFIVLFSRSGLNLLAQQI